MIDVFPFMGFTIAVFGLGRSGLSTARALVASGADVWAWDDDETARQRGLEHNIPIVDLYKVDFSKTTTLVVSPGIPIDAPTPHPLVLRAREVDCEVIGDAELLVRAQRDAAYIGITGTNGKSTTTALIGHIMQTCGREAEVGGNIGTPCLDLEPLGTEGTYVLEMSSYQLDLTVSITFDVGILLNISQDHLERHGGINGYIKAKEQIFHRQTQPRTAIISVDDKYCKKIFQKLSAVNEQHIVPISGCKKVPGGIFVLDGLLIDDTEGDQKEIINLLEVAALPGIHNHQNAAAAFAACKAAGVHPSVIQACIRSYPGLAHRQELAAVIDGVVFVNDSKATNPDAAARALACYRNIYWIVGGRPKDNRLEPCFEYLQNVCHVFLVGEAAKDFAITLQGKKGLTISKTISTAVIDAFDLAKKGKKKGTVVLLSPACSSFDQFNNFEERGDYFKEIIDTLNGKHSDPFDDLDDYVLHSYKETAGR